MTDRRPLKFASIEQATAEIDRLRRGGYDRRGTWSLAQMARHLSRVIDENLVPPASTEPTADEQAMRDKFFGMVLAPGGMPAGLPLAESAVPPTDSPDSEVDRLVASLYGLKTCPYPYIKVGRCGPVPLAKLIELHLAHTAHHLSFLDPKIGLLPDGRPRTLRFKSADELKSDVQALRTKRHQKLGHWTLPQIAKHLTTAMNLGLDSPAAEAPATPEQAAAKVAVFDTYLNTGKPPAGMKSPPGLLPGDDCDDADVDHFLSALAKLMDCDKPVLMMGPFGPVAIAECREFHLIHAAHHLGHLIPGDRRDVHYADEAAVIADVLRLKAGHTQHGSWTLAQACWHLGVGVKSRMAPWPPPVPANTPEQDARRPMVEQILSTGRLPDGLPAAGPMVPPADRGDEAIDEFVGLMNQFAVFTGPIPPHRLFGNLPDVDARRLNLIHCAHHLSRFEPTRAAAGLMIAKPAGYRSAKYASGAEASADLRRLRAGHRKLGTWDLPMVAWHLAEVMGEKMTPPASPVPTPAQAARKKGFVDVVLATGGPPPGIIPPASVMPPLACSAADVDRLERLLAAMDAYPHPMVDMGPFGPVPADEFRRLQLAHLAHHLSFLVPA